MDRLAQVVFFNKGWDKGMQLFRESLSMSAGMKDGQYRAHTYGMMSASYYIMGDSTSAYRCLDSAFYYVRRSHSKTIHGLTLYFKGWLEVRSGRETEAIRSFQQALDQYEQEPGTLRYKQTVYSELAGVYFRWYDMVNVEKYTRLSLEAARSVNQLDRLISANQERGSYFINFYRSGKAEQSAVDSALCYMRSALELARSNRDRLTTPSDIPFAAIGISNIFLAYLPRTTANLDSIYYYNNIALEESKLTKQFAVEAGVYNTLATMALDNGDYDAALNYLNGAVLTSLSDPLFDKFGLAESYRMMALVHEKKDEDSLALDYYKQYMTLYQEQFDAAKMNQARDLETKYEIAKKEKALLEIRFLAEQRSRELIQARLLSGQKDRDLLAARYAAILQDKELLAVRYASELQQKALAGANYKTAQREQQLKVMSDRISYNHKMNKIYAALTLALFLAALLLYYAYKQRSKALRQEKQLHELELGKMKQEHRIAKLGAMLEGQEQERTRLARDLHDGLGGLLSGIKIDLSALTPLVADPRPKAIVGTTLNHLDNAVDELRRIARSMMPEVLLSYGLGEAIREYCNGLQRSGVPVACQVYHYKNDMNHNRQVTLYRIMQELVNNAVKHARASQILVQLQQSDDLIFLTVEDDGCGFDKAVMDSLKGAGLANIQSRVEMLQGRMEVRSDSGTGTTFTVECSVN